MILGVEEAHESNRATTSNRIIVVGCYTGLRDDDSGESWYVFSRDGGFTKNHKFISIADFSDSPKRGQCYEMAVKYERAEDYCYYFGVAPDLHSCDPGWNQTTREFRLTDTSLWRTIPKAEWQRDYADAYAK